LQEVVFYVFVIFETNSLVLSRNVPARTKSIAVRCCHRCRSCCYGTGQEMSHWRGVLVNHHALLTLHTGIA